MAEEAGRKGRLLEGAGEGRRLTMRPRGPVPDPGAGWQGPRPAQPSPALSLHTEGQGSRSPLPAVPAQEGLGPRGPSPPHPRGDRASRWDPGRPSPPRMETHAHLLRSTEYPPCTAAVPKKGRAHLQTEPGSVVRPPPWPRADPTPEPAAPSSPPPQNRQPRSAFLSEQTPGARAFASKPSSLFSSAVGFSRKVHGEPQSWQSCYERGGESRHVCTYQH